MCVCRSDPASVSSICLIPNDIVQKHSVIHQSEFPVCFHEYTARFLVWLDIRHGAALGLTVMLISADVMADGSVI